MKSFCPNDPHHTAMSRCINQILLAFIVAVIIQEVSATRASTWDECNCSWDSWKPWTDCTATCAGGYRTRRRSVFNLEEPHCEGFEVCASNDEGWRHEYCGTNCYNGGTYIWINTCKCSPGWQGKCCEERVKCGQPSDIAHGQMVVKGVTFGDTVTYQCDHNYQLAAGDDNVRLCTGGGYWSGSTPTCVYMASCLSNLCENGGTCTNIPGGYTCQCRTDWEGPNCNIDMAPPSVRNCPESHDIYTQDLMAEYKWDEPDFLDDRGQEIIISKNYNQPKFEFPWGKFPVNYKGVKANNGLHADCKFTIYVKPLPCQDLPEVENGFYVCNGWNTDYSNVCTLMCKPGFNPLFPATNLFVCTARGNWYHDNMYSYICLPNEVGTIGPKWDGPKNTNCTDREQKLAIGEFYVDRLQKHTDYTKLCEDFKSECNKNNMVYHYC